MIPLFVSTELVLERITVQAQQDIWERVGNRFIWSRRLGWQWWQVLRLNHHHADLAHIRTALIAERGEPQVLRAESLTIPHDYRLPPGCQGWLTHSRYAA